MKSLIELKSKPYIIAELSSNHCKNIEITIKGITKSVPLELEITNFTNELVQVRGKLEFSRNDFNIGTGQWRNTTILKDNIKLEANIFLIKE